MALSLFVPCTRQHVKKVLSILCLLNALKRHSLVIVHYERHLAVEQTVRKEPFNLNSVICKLVLHFLIFRQL